MSKFHLTEKGPKICKAITRNCPFTPSEHYDSFEKASIAFEEKNKMKVFSSNQKLSLDSLELTSSDMRKLLKEFFPGSNYELQAFNYVGSKLFGLNTPTSDTDYFLIVDGHSKAKHKIVDGIDVVVFPIYTFAENLSHSTPDAVHVYRGQIKFVEGSPWEQYFSSYKFDPYHYSTKTYVHLGNDFQNFKTKFGGSNEKTGIKSLKTTLRNAVLLNKLWNSNSDDFNVKFSPLERERFYEKFSELVDKKEKLVDMELEEYIDFIIPESKSIIEK